jgi:hypothetical protein
MVFASLAEPLNVAADVREMTRKARIRHRSAVISSARPSAKNSLSGSALRLVNDSTAIDDDPVEPLPAAD